MQYVMMRGSYLRNPINIPVEIKFGKILLVSDIHFM